MTQEPIKTFSAPIPISKAEQIRQTLRTMEVSACFDTEYNRNGIYRLAKEVGVTIETRRTKEGKTRVWIEQRTNESMNKAWIDRAKAT